MSSEAKDRQLHSVISYHLILEDVVNKLIDSRFPNPKSVHDVGLSLKSKIKILDGLNVFRNPEKWLPPLYGINKLRNKFAHNIQTRFTRKEINEIVGDNQAIKDAMARSLKRMKEDPEYGDLFEVFYEKDSDSDVLSDFHFVAGHCINYLLHLLKSTSPSESA